MFCLFDGLKHRPVRQNWALSPSVVHLPAAPRSAPGAPRLARRVEPGQSLLRHPPPGSATAPSSLKSRQTCAPLSSLSASTTPPSVPLAAPCPRSRASLVRMVSHRCPPTHRDNKSGSSLELARARNL